MKLDCNDGVSNGQDCRAREKSSSFVYLRSPRFLAKNLALNAKGFHKRSVIEKGSEEAFCSATMTAHGASQQLIHGNGCL